MKRGPILGLSSANWWRLLLPNGPVARHAFRRGSVPLPQMARTHGRRMQRAGKGAAWAGFALVAILVLAAVVPSSRNARARITGPHTLHAYEGEPVTVTVAVTDVLVVGGTTAVVTVTVVDAAGAPVQDGTGLLLDTTLGTLDHVTGVTAGGKFTSTLTTGTRSGTADIVAVAAEAVGSAAVRFQALETAYITVTATANSVVGSNVDVGLTLVDRYSNPVEDGTTVGLAVAGGELDNAELVAAAGGATALLTSERAGRAYITATSGTGRGTVEVRFRPGPPAGLDVGLERAQLPVNEGTTPIELLVLDQYGNRVDVPVAVNMSAGGGTVTPARLVAFAGRGEAQYRADAAPGMFHVTAQTTEGLASSDSLELRPADVGIQTTVIGPRGPIPDEQIHPGDAVTYRVLVENKDLATAKNLDLAVVLPDLLVAGTAVGSRPISPRANGPPGLIEVPDESYTRLDWKLPDLEGGGQMSVDIPARLVSGVTWTGFDSMFLRAAVAHVTAEASTADMRRGDFVSVHATDLFLNLEVDRTASDLRPGGEIVYEIILGNDMRATKHFGVVVTDTLPVGTTYRRWQQAGDAGVVAEASNFSVAARELVWSFSGEFGLSQSIRLTLGIDSDATHATTLENVARIGGAVHDVQPGNNERRNVLRLGGVNLSAEVESPATAAPGDRIAYALAAVNNSQSEMATGVTLVAWPPEGARIVALGGGAPRPDGSVVWQVGELAAGGRRDYGLEIEVPETALMGEVLSHSVEVRGVELEAYPQDNVSSALVRVVAGPPAKVDVAVGSGSLRACTDETTTLRATVRDRFDNPVADGTVVQWLAPQLQLSGAATTTRDGVATNVSSAGQVLGPAVVRAFAGGTTGEATITQLPGPVRGLSVTALPTIIGVGGRAVVSVAVLDGCSRPAEDGALIRLSADRGLFSGRPSIELQSHGGSVTARLDVGTEAGPIRVTASHGEVRGEAVIAVSSTVQPTPPPNRPIAYLPLVMSRRSGAMGHQ
jgi:uncharacterized repeat protein (TIGR01451 family)